MTKHEKIAYAQAQICVEWGIPADSFAGSENLFFETDKIFFEYITFGGNAAIRADKEILGWLKEEFSETQANYIPDEQSLYAIESKLREHGKKLAGEHLRFLRLNEDVRVPAPDGFSFEFYEADRIPELYADKRFTEAFKYKNDMLALVARQSEEIAAIVATDNFTPGFWEIGIDTLAEFRGRGLAAYLVNTIAVEIERRGHVPFYNTWAANIASMRVAISAGFLPAWLGYYSENLEE